MQNFKVNARTHSIISAISQKTGLAFDYDATLPANVAGFYDAKNKKIVLNPGHEKALDYAVVHELTHFVENKKGYGAYVKNIMGSVVYKDWIATNYKGDETLYYKEIYDTYYENYKQYDDKTLNSLLEREMVAKFNEYLINEKPEALARLSKNDTGIKAVYNSICEFFEEIKTFLKGDSEKAYALRMARKFRQLATDKDVTNSNNSIDVETRYSVKEIVGESNKNYGIGVYLDSDLLTNLTEEERKEMVKEFVVTELAGEHFTAYDNNNDAIDIRIAKKSDKIKNKNNKDKKIIKELYSKYSKFTIKQEAIVLIDELISSAKYDTSKKPNYSHDWLDNYGQNDWDYWTVYIQEKNKSVWEATLNIANTSNGEKILYDINPINMVEEGVKSPSASTNNNIPHQKSIVNTNSMQNSEKNSEIRQLSVSGTAEKNGTTTENKSKDLENKNTFDSERVYKIEKTSYNEYTKEEYENYGWARANNILNAGQNSDYRSKFAMAKSGQAKFSKSKSGEFIIPVSDINDSTFRGINNVLVFASGEIDKPIITKVIEIFEYDETNLNKVRKYIYGLERRGISTKSGQVIRRYDAFDFTNDYSGRNNKNSGHNNDNGNGRGNSEQTSSTEEPKKYSIIPTAEKNGTDIENKSKEERYQELIKKYRTIPQGENPYREVEVPKRSSDKKYVSRHARVDETNPTNIYDAQNLIDNNRIMYINPNKKELNPSRPSPSFQKLHSEVQLLLITMYHNLITLSIIILCKTLKLMHELILLFLLFHKKQVLPSIMMQLFRKILPAIMMVKLKKLY